MKATYISAAPVGDADRFLESTNMKVGAYTLLLSGAMVSGGRIVTCTRTVAATADTPGTLVLVGTNLAGQTITETLTVGANSILVSSTKVFKKLTSATGAGWVIDAVEGTHDTLQIGCAADCYVAEGSGTLARVIIGETAASAITFTDKTGTIAVLKASIGEGSYEFGLNYSGFLRVDPAGASKITVVHSDSQPVYATA